MALVVLFSDADPCRTHISPGLFTTRLVTHIARNYSGAAR